ncbi:MAG: type II toxin-antitoxin system HicA family toxin [Treponema sp.]|jgi:predicted RNA binding protein YcfA (HicA-like mRNA interferase family)|nr:type II toxin-antitoxin system HicA family toxin [Treponema sp.]
MNRKDFICFLEQYGLQFYRHGSKHDIYIHKITGKKVAVPRHAEIKNKFLKKILNEITRQNLL